MAEKPKELSMEDKIKAAEETNHVIPGTEGIDSFSVAKRPTVQAPGEFGSLVRGAGSGLLGGLQPEIAAGLSTGHIPFTERNMWGDQNEYKKSMAESEALNEAAWKEHPGYYGAGYTGGTAASLIGPGAVAKGTQLGFQGLKAARGASIANEANAARAAQIPQIMEEAAQAGRSLTYNDAAAQAGRAMPVPQGPTNIGRQALQRGADTALPQIPAQMLLRSNTGQGNAPAAVPQQPAGAPQKVGQWGQLTDYLANFDGDEKRKAAMAMIASGQGLSDAG